LGSASPAEFEKVVQLVQKLGEFQKYKESSGVPIFSILPSTAKTLTAEYTAQVDFDTGPARVRIVTVKKGDQWKNPGFQHQLSGAIQ